MASPLLNSVGLNLKWNSLWSFDTVQDSARSTARWTDSSILTRFRKHWSVIINAEADPRTRGLNCEGRLSRSTFNCVLPHENCGANNEKRSTTLLVLKNIVLLSSAYLPTSQTTKSRGFSVRILFLDWVSHFFAVSTSWAEAPKVHRRVPAPIIERNFLNMISSIVLGADS